MRRLSLPSHDAGKLRSDDATPLTVSKATKADVEAHFATHGTGEITEIKLMNGFGFIEYKDAMDARDVVPGKFFATSNLTTKSTLC